MTLSSARGTSVLLCVLASAVTWWTLTGVASAAPTNTTPPSITGTAQQGQSLTLHHGTWSDTTTPPPTITITDQWETCSGVTCSAITGQTQATYTVAASDVGHTIEVLETATDTGGVASISSSPTLLIVAPPTEISAPSISGTPQQGSVLTESHGTWTGSPTSYSYQWKRCLSSSCALISGATGPSYTPAAVDLGAAILVAETAINAGGSSAPADSALTGVVASPAGVVPVPASISPPTVSGLPRQGQTLREAHGTWSGNPEAFRYQWQSCGVAGCASLPGALGQTYTLTAADVGQTIVVLETAANSGGSSIAAASRHTTAVTATSSTSLVVSPSSPTTNQTVTLVATVSSSSGSAYPSGWLTFFNGSNAISGCANESFKSTSPTITLICQGSFSAGTANFTAVYTPRTELLVEASASPLIRLSIGRDSTSTALAVTKQVVRRKRARYTATLVLPVSNSGPIRPTGSMEFLDSGRPIRGCLRRPLTQLAATCAVNYKSVGRHDISAYYTGDSNFGSSTSPTRSVRIVKDSSAPIVLGFISSTLQWQFHYHRAYTQVTMLRADGVVKGTTVLLTCEGFGCPTSQWSFEPKTGASIDLLPVFQSRHLRVGSRITVRIMRPHWIGKYYSFTVRAGSGPLILLSCLGVGRTRPGVGC